MPKTATDTAQTRLNGATMGTEWSVLVHAPLSTSSHAALQTDLQRTVDEVDNQMSTWKPDSALMRFNAAPVEVWHAMPKHLLQVLQTGLAISAISKGAFEMNLGDAVRAWGFSSDAIDLAAIRSASAAPRVPALAALDLDLPAGLARKTAPLALDLSGIAKGYGVDRLAETVVAYGIAHALCAIDGEVRAVGTRADGAPWSVGIDAPDSGLRGSHSVIALANAAVATSGDYRHFLTIRNTRLSHTMDPSTRAPVIEAPASVTVLGQSCVFADAMATALMVTGRTRARRLAVDQGISALLLERSGELLCTGLFKDTARLIN
ncbi:thiamine biosynthesis protein ApbE [Gemmobacter aquarius]|uniref:FAD:protein FMN transferase n=1 Tax=Paragemmobacter aquarius TaxID=2169400 RepID=A0A2S0UM22_9RHOB|nr:FAD:protein FMN transferase [Gemmobacter aquarius]AWB48841.1 thiamine biosynthesis protein ApbE [Gemmobacter aquarius]